MKVYTKEPLGPEQFQSGVDQSLPEARLFAGQRASNPVIGSADTAGGNNPNTWPQEDIVWAGGNQMDSGQAGRAGSVPVSPHPVIGAVSPKDAPSEENAMFDDGPGRAFAWKVNGAAADTGSAKLQAGSKGSGGIPA